ncbi:diacylglycerol kinase [Limnochorda pilosa]|uniref:Diacylglycerol kinase n=1 Tax=Limnochorda pilosa TaxID=1555112 RepID=A0A0K2SNR7_LIMPI|nr:diacylglycerol kinase [Limnochorda pilosa]BAS28474.1 diacylglycerol kinase [Limnochorda pilosa]
MGRKPAAAAGVGWHRARTLAESFRFAWQGFSAALRTQRNLRIHVAAGVLAVATAWALHLPWVQVALVTLAAAAVIGAELFNSALEGLVDLVEARQHPGARQVKDLAAAAVLVAAVGALLVGGVLFLPPLLRLLGR